MSPRKPSMNRSVNRRIGARLITGFCLFASGVLYGDNILLIGDSISLGYQYRAQLYAGDRHTIVHPMVNALTSTFCKNNIENWLLMTNTLWDAVHFNVGLHDIVRLPDISAPPKTAVETYQENLRDIVEIIRNDSPCAVIVFALSTPVLSQTNRIPEDVAVYNSAATNVLADQNVYINDLYSLMLPHQEEYHLPDGTHFTSDGNQFNAENVVDFIDSIPRPPPCLWADGHWIKYTARSNWIYNVYYSTNTGAGHGRLLETNISGGGEVHSFHISEGGGSSGWYWIGATSEE